MSDNPLLNKMDALLKKHRGSEGETGTNETAPAHAAPPDAWLPVLTQVIERGSPPPLGTTATAAPAVAPPAVAAPATASDVLTEQLMSELAPRLSEAVEKIVRDAVAEKLKQTRDPSN